MTTNVLVVVADAVKTALEGITLSQRFELYRSYGDWEDVLTDFDGLRIDVVPQSCPSTIFSQAKHEYECHINILLRKLIKPEDRKAGRIDNAVIDQLVGDLQTVHEYFIPSTPTQNGLRLSSVQQARWIEGSIKAPFSRKLLKDPGQYSGWAEVVFGYAKAAGA